MAEPIDNGINKFMLFEIPCEDTFLLYLNGQLRFKEDYKLTNNGIMAFIEWLNPNGLFLECTDSLLARYISKNGGYYIDQQFLNHHIERKRRFLSRIIQSIIKLFKKEEEEE